MNVVLNPELERFVEDQIKSGRYASVGDLIQSAISRLKTSDDLSDVEDLRQEAAIGLGEADRGEFVEFTAETIIAEGRKMLEARRSSPK